MPQSSSILTGWKRVPLGSLSWQSAAFEALPEAMFAAQRRAIWATPLVLKGAWRAGI
jgi:hypothetical protein